MLKQWLRRILDEWWTEKLENEATLKKAEMKPKYYGSPAEKEKYPWQDWRLYWPKLRLESSFPAEVYSMMQKRGIAAFKVLLPSYLEGMEEAKPMLASARLVGLEIAFGEGVDSIMGYDLPTGTHNLGYTITPTYFSPGPNPTVTTFAGSRVVP